LIILRTIIKAQMIYIGGQGIVYKY